MLAVRGIDTHRGPVHVLRGLSLEVRRGEAVCLVGRNGAGKTTAIESIMGFLPVRSGSVVLGDRDITRLAPHERARLGVGYAPEGAGVFPDLTVAENLDISLWLAAGHAGAGSAAPAAMLEDRIFAVFPEVRRLLDRRGTHLSGGEKKMVAIARAMALDPRVLLLDEAFEGLAPVVVDRFIDAVARIKAMGISLLLAESNVVTATRVADRLYAIERGEIIYAGDPAAVFDQAEVMRTIRG
ncbi:MAG TPA: ABC transporter ATP-binding protein [Thermodesulfobacteriota bacterium]